MAKLLTKQEIEANKPKSLGILYEKKLFPLIQRFNKFHDDAERVHNIFLWLMVLAQKSPRVLSSVQHTHEYKNPRLKTNVGNIELDHPFGLAAGFDKNCVAPLALFAFLGVSSISFGTVTRYAQPGRKERPRIVRLEEDQSSINFMGFPSSGSDRVSRNIAWARKHLDPRLKIGVSIGINANRREVEQMGTDLAEMIEQLYPHADFFEECFSCPNVTGLCAFQKQEDAIVAVIEPSIAKRNELAEKTGRRVDIYYKVSPDPEPAAVDSSIRVVRRTGMDGYVATNTYAGRPPELRSRRKKYPGGLGGKAIESLATQTVFRLDERSEGEKPIIGVGGVSDGRSMARKILAGACAVQAQTAIPFRFPVLVPDSNKGLMYIMNRGAFSSVKDMVGFAHKHPDNRLIRDLFPEKW